MKFCQSVNANASFLSQCHVSPYSQKCFTLPHIVQFRFRWWCWKSSAACEKVEPSQTSIGAKDVMTSDFDLRQCLWKGTSWSIWRRRTVTRWWFHLLIIFNPSWGNLMIQCQSVIFRIGWNHQLGQFAAEIEEYVGVGWFVRKFGVKEDGTGGMPAPDLDAEIGEDEEDDDGIEVSTFNSRAPLINLLERLVHNRMELSLCKLAKESVPGKSLMLCTKDEVLQKILDNIKDKYMKDFPPQQATQAGAFVGSGWCGAVFNLSIFLFVSWVIGQKWLMLHSLFSFGPWLSLWVRLRAPESCTSQTSFCRTPSKFAPRMSLKRRRSTSLRCRSITKRPRILKRWQWRLGVAAALVHVLTEFQTANPLSMLSQHMARSLSTIGSIWWLTVFLMTWAARSWRIGWSRRSAPSSSWHLAAVRWMLCSTYGVIHACIWRLAKVWDRLWRFGGLGRD